MSVFALGFLACQGSRDASAPATSPPPVSTTRPAGETLGARADAALAPLVCEESKYCPEAVGELMAYNESSQLTFCTVTLIAPDLALTASHCVPWHLLGDDRKFHGGCRVRFAAGARASDKGAGSDGVDCGEIAEATSLQAQNGKHLQADFALIRLAHAVDRKPLRVAARNEPHDRHRFNVLFGVKIDRDLHSVTMLACARDDAFNLAPLTVRAGQSVVMPSCGVRAGFSGGPILDPVSREIVAVISGVLGYDPAKPDQPRPSIGTLVSRPDFAPLARAKSAR